MKRNRNICNEFNSSSFIGIEYKPIACYINEKISPNKWESNVEVEVKTEEEITRDGL